MLFIQPHERLQLLGTLIKLVWSAWGWCWEISTIICAYFGKYGQTICEKLFNKQTHSKRTYKRVSIYYVSKTIRQHFFNPSTYRTGSPRTRGFPEAEEWVSYVDICCNTFLDYKLCTNRPSTRVDSAWYRDMISRWSEIYSHLVTTRHSLSPK